MVKILIRLLKTAIFWLKFYTEGVPQDTGFLFSWQNLIDSVNFDKDLNLRIIPSEVKPGWMCFQTLKSLKKMKKHFCSSLGIHFWAKNAFFSIFRLELKTFHCNRQLATKKNFDVIIISLHLNPERFPRKSNLILFDVLWRLKIHSKTTSNATNPLNFEKMA